MIGAGATFSTPICFSSIIPCKTLNFNRSNCFSRKFVNPLSLSYYHPSCSLPNDASPNKFHTHLSVKASSSVESAEYTEEPATNVKFQKTLLLPGCSGPLLLLGTGYREKVFAIIGVKVYAAGLYVNQSILSKSNEIQKDSSLFKSIFQAPMEKSLQIVLVRDVDGKTFWDALDEAISPRLKSPTPVDKSALSTFRSTFESRPLKKGTFIFLTWLDPSKMLVSISLSGLPSGVDATIESENVTSALYDVFFGDAPVSSTLKASVAEGLATILK